MKRTKKPEASEPELRRGMDAEGFTINRVTPIPDLRATAIKATHRGSGARVLHIFAPADSENCFAVTFPTPPPDETGLPHIMEHAVLGGSKKFPVREPFFEMLKMSMATFINAMTAQAYTVYPLASNVKKDFFNLVEVYLDAVFQPLLTGDIFQREGHHLAFENNSDPCSPLKISGIVYNEMQGVYSMPEAIMEQLAGRGLFPDTPLGRDSGGNPEHIPELTFDQFNRFHAERYHPGNGLFFIYGDIPTIEHLRFLAPILNNFKSRAQGIPVPRQRRWTEPRNIEKNYPAGAETGLAGHTFITLNWIVGDALDPEQVIAWKTLSALLFGNNAAPLKKAIIDSKLGSDIFCSGAQSHAYELCFHVGLKGSEPDRAGSFERLVFNKLQRLAEKPFPAARVEAAFQQLAYDTLEVKTLFPLHLLFAANAAWPFKADPLRFLAAGRHLRDCRARYSDDPRYFNRLIQEGLLKNPHRLRVILRPDREVQARADSEFAAKMAGLRARLNDAQRMEIAKSASALAAAQGRPNSQKALARLPQLKIGDLPSVPRHIPAITGRIADMVVLRNDVFANGVNYLEIDMDLAGLPAELRCWLPHFREAVAGMGAAGRKFTGIAERRASCTGGLWSRANAWQHASDPDQTLLRFRFGMKTLDEQAEKALALLGDLIFELDPRDPERLRDILVQSRAFYRTNLVDNGAITARNRAARSFSLAASLNHMFMSPDALRFLEDLTDNFERRSDEIIFNIERIRDFIVSRAQWTVSFTGSEPVFRKLTRTLENWAQRRNHKNSTGSLPAFKPSPAPSREGLAAQMLIAHCVKTMPAPHMEHHDTPMLKLGAYLAMFDFFLPEIRFKGNAYGAGIGYDDANKTLFMTSFRDPNIAETLAVFNRLRDYMAGRRWSRTDINRAIIGSAKEIEKPVRPAEATTTRLTRYARGETDELRERHYTATLRATPSSVKRTMLDFLDANEKLSAVCVVSSREKLDQANSALGGKPLVISDIL